MDFISGTMKAIFRRGVKYAEQVRDHSKTAISMMFCGNGNGDFLPPYVLYKGNNVYESWYSGGPDKAVYSSSPSGWFDMCIFEDWFKKLFLPHVRRQPGRKVLLGDNIASHISMELIRLCRDNDIQFICLPPNSTDKMQPLDVGIFGPMKAAWRKQLKKYADLDPTAKLLKKNRVPQDDKGAAAGPETERAPAQGLREVRALSHQQAEGPGPHPQRPGEPRHCPQPGPAAA